MGKSLFYFRPNSLSPVDLFIGIALIRNHGREEHSGEEGSENGSRFLDVVIRGGDHETNFADDACNGGHASAGDVAYRAEGSEEDLFKREGM
jgi:hypothetical protein